MSDKPTTWSAVEQIAPEPRARTASPPREDVSEARRGAQRHSEVSAIIANANRDLARKASALSASLAAMDEAASIAAHNTRVDAGRGEAPREDGVQAQPDTPPEKIDAAHAGLSQSASAALARAVVDSSAIPDACRCPRAPWSEPRSDRMRPRKKSRLVVFVSAFPAVSSSAALQFERSVGSHCTHARRVSTATRRGRS